MSIPFVIRDDDLSGYLDAAKLSSFYEPFLKEGFKVSFSAIPEERETFFKSDRSRFYQTDKFRKFGENFKLVQWVKEKLKAGQIEIMLHGYDHTYSYKDGRFVGECAYKSASTLKVDLKKGKDYLEGLLDTTVVSFVPPSNQVGAAGIRVLQGLGIKYISGTVSPLFNRPVSFTYLKNWFRYCFYLGLKRRRYPFVLPGRLKELTYYTLSPRVSLESLKADFAYCQRNKAPFVLATHGWELWENEVMRSVFKSFLAYVKERGVKPVLFKDLF